MGPHAVNFNFNRVFFEYYLMFLFELMDKILERVLRKL